MSESTPTTAFRAAIPASVWAQSGRPTWATAIRLYLTFTLVWIGLFFSAPIPRYGLITAGIALFLAFPRLIASRLRPLERAVAAADRQSASRILHRVRSRRLVKTFAPRAWRSVHEGLLHLAAGDGRAAARALATAARQGKRAPALLEAQVHAHLLGGELKEAAALIADKQGEGSEAEAMSPWAQVHRALLDLHGGRRFAEAARALAAAREVLGDHPWILAGLTLACERSGDLAEAERLSQAATAAAADPLALGLLKRAEKGLRSYRKAQQQAGSRRSRRRQATPEQVAAPEAAEEASSDPTSPSSKPREREEGSAKGRQSSGKKARKQARRDARRRAKAEARERRTAPQRARKKGSRPETPSLGEAVSRGAEERTGGDLAGAESLSAEVTVAGSAMPESAMPESAMPESAMPESAMPESAMPESAMPESAMPESAAPPSRSQPPPRPAAELATPATPEGNRRSPGIVLPPLVRADEARERPLPRRPGFGAGSRTPRPPPPPPRIAGPPRPPQLNLPPLTGRPRGGLPTRPSSLPSLPAKGGEAGQERGRLDPQGPTQAPRTSRAEPRGASEAPALGGAPIPAPPPAPVALQAPVLAPPVIHAPAPSGASDAEVSPLDSEWDDLETLFNDEPG